MSKQTNGIELAQHIESLVHQLPLHIKTQAVRAELYYKYFQQLIKEGFTEAQALELIKARGLD